LHNYQLSIENGISPAPVVEETDGEWINFYAPILLAPLCQKCHGIPGETMGLENYDIIQKYYPEDEAINYKSGDLRGLWSISFRKKTEPKLSE